MSTDSVRVQVEALRRKLLDLSLRNRMLNYRPSKRLGITILGEDSFLLHRILVEDGKRLSFVGKPDPPKAPKEITSTLYGKDDAVKMAQYRKAAEDEMDAFLDNAAVPVDQLDTKLNTDEYVSELQAKLRTIAREAQLANDELGINTLFVTLGALEWSEGDERTYRAPLIFVPIRLEKQANGSMRLVHDGSDVGTNLPLRAKLAEFNLTLPELDEEKTLLDYFSEVESTIQGRSNWRVHYNEICLGFFNYEKYAMYVDLGGDAWPENQKPWQHADLVAMLGAGYSSPESRVDGETLLDEVRPVSAAHEVYDADSSQTLAMIRAAEGLSIVVEGPPGTGKSQTITNIIAEAVAAGKSVLFVSAKRAALEVVKRNMERADLGAMCLDLHDKLTNRREFYSELKRTVGKSISMKSEEEKVSRLTELRDKLNAHSAAVNEPIEPYGATPFGAMAILGKLPKEMPEDRDGRIPFELLKGWSEMDIRSALPAVRAVQERIGSIGIPVLHPFWGCEIDYVDPARRLDLEEDLTSAKPLVAEAIEKFDAAAARLQVDVEPSLENVQTLRVCTELALAAPRHDGVAVRTDTWKQEESSVRNVVAELRVWQEAHARYGASVQPEIWTADIAPIGAAYDAYADRWYKFIIGDYRRARARLDAYVIAVPEPARRRDLVRDVRRAQAAAAAINSATGTMSRLFGVQWQGAETDPAIIERLLDWVLALHARVQSKDLPAGLLDFFSGNHSDQDLLPLIEAAEQASQRAADAYGKVAKLLGYGPGDRYDDASGGESWPAIATRIAAWHANLARLPEYIAFNEARRQALAKDLSPVMEVADRWPLAGERLSDAFLRSYYSGVVREAMQSRPELRTFERVGHEAAIDEFQSLDDFKLKYNRAQVRLAHQKRLPTFENALGNLHLLKLQCELQRKHKPIRWIMARAGEAIQRIKPVFMMSPLSVAIHLPPELPLFDMVIFDEASQIKPEDSLSAIIRARQAIVVGDTRQMPPTSFFDRLADDEDEVDDGSAESELGNEARKLESVLSLMSGVTLGRVRRPDLRWHYRSVHPSLIQPSNEMFYENRLIVFPSPSSVQEGRRIGVVFHHHPETVYEAGSKNRVNKEEARLVADAVLKHVQTRGDESLLVAAMNKPQADLIFDEVQKREREDPQAFEAYRSKFPHEPLAVKNLENVQGDERDVVFISVTYGRDSEGILRQQFGPLLQDGGERRLNVLITRARSRCEVFSNIAADDIRSDKPRAGVQSLKRYLQFAATGIIEVATPTGGEAESPFEEEVASALRDHGFEIHPQIGSEGYRIDIGIVDPAHPGRYLLGVECDGATYHAARSARDRDKLRQRVLEKRGWRLHRIWSHDWWQDRDGEVRRLLAAIESAPLEVEEPEDEVADVIVQESDRESQSTGKTREYISAPAGSVSNDAEADRYVQAVIRAEGPICYDLLFLRLKEAAGHTRLTAGAKAWINAAIVRGAKGFKHVGDGYFVDEQQIRQPRDWSTRPTAERKVEFVPEVEIAAALREVVRTAFGISEEAAVKAAFNLLGFKRVTDKAEARATVVLGKMIEAGGVLRREGQLVSP